jgi:DNA-directed RNA polymerase subunit N (RpoN/RPB10)
MRICKSNKETTQWPQYTKGVTRIKEGQTTQWPQDTKGVIRICKGPLIYRFWLPLWYLVVIVLSFFDLQIMVTPLVSFGHCVGSKYTTGVTRIKEGQTTQGPQDTKGVTRICKSNKETTHWPQHTKGVTRIKDLGIFWSLCCLSFFGLQIMVTPLVSFGHCVVCPSLIDRFWLPL